jgi:hypothetical protein
MYYVQLWEEEKEMALQQYLYDITGYIILTCFIILSSVILHEINIV